MCFTRVGGVNDKYTITFQTLNFIEGNISDNMHLRNYEKYTQL